MNAITEQQQLVRHHGDPDQMWLNLPEDMSFDEWIKLGRLVILRFRRASWDLGDWLKFGLDPKRGWESQELQEALSVIRADAVRLTPVLETCRRFPEEKRHHRLTFAHHAAVMAIDDDAEADALLTEAEREGATVALLKATVRVRTAGDRLPGMVEDDDPIDTAYRRIVQAWNCAPRASRELFAESVAESHMGVIEL